MKTTPLFIAISISVSLHAQDVDETRLSFDNNSITSQQAAHSVSPNGNLMAFAYKDLTIKIFDIKTNKFTRYLKSPIQEIYDIIITNDDKLIVCSTKEVAILNVKTGTTTDSFVTDSEYTRVVYSPSGILAFGQVNGKTIIYDLALGKERMKIETSNKGFVGGLAIRPGGKEIAIGIVPGFGNVEDKRIEIYDAFTGKLVRQATIGGWLFMCEYDLLGEKLLVGGNRPGNQYRFVTTLDAETLKEENFVKFRVALGNLNEAGTYISGFIANSNKVFTMSHTNAFNVIDYSTLMRTFSTLSDSKNFGGRDEKKGIRRNVNQIAHLGNNKFLINFFFNNVSQVYDLNSNQIVAYMFSDSNEDFAVIARDGRIDGTPGGLSKIHWTSRKSDKKTLIESTFEKNFTPRLLSEIINANELRQEFNIDDVASKIPTIEINMVNGNKLNNSSIETPLKSCKVDVKVKENAAEVREIKLFHNAKFIKAIPNNGSDTYSFTVNLNNSFGENNYFYCIASSKSGVDSDKSKFNIIYKSASDEKPKLYLVTVGINDYKNPKYKLNYAVADADGVANSIKKFSNSLFTQIISYEVRNDRAVKENMQNVLEEVRSKSLEQDVLIVYYAGHGVVSKTNTEEEFYIVPYDVTQLYGSVEILEQRAISATMLKQLAQSINAQKQFFILDACQSSGALESAANRGVAEERALAQLARSTGTFWLAATGSDQYATEFNKLGHGLFTYTLLNGLNGEADADKDGKLTVRELSTFIENKVPELSEELKGSAQYPSSFSFGNDFPLVLYK